MAGKLLLKRFGIRDVIFRLISHFYNGVQVPIWMTNTDEDRDGRLTYKEFKTSLLEAKKIEKNN